MVYLGVAVFLIVVFLILRGRGKPLFSFKFGSSSDFEFRFGFDYHRSDLAPIEFCRAPFLFLARWLYASSTHDSLLADELRKMVISMERLNFGNIQEFRSSVEELLKEFRSDVNMDIKLGPPRPPIVAGTVLFKSTFRRYVITKMPRNPYLGQYYGAWLALLLTCGEKITDHELELLESATRDALTIVGNRGNDLRTMSGMMEWPNVIFDKAFADRYSSKDSSVTIRREEPDVEDFEFK